MPPPATGVPSSAREIELMIFELLRDNFCASGREAELIGQHLRDEMLIKLEAKSTKLREAVAELKKQSGADYFITKVAMVDPVEGEILITERRVMDLCSKFEVDELHMLYERLRAIKVARLREGYGTDIVSIVSANGEERQSFCEGRDRENARRARISAQQQAHRDEMEGDGVSGSGNHEQGSIDMQDFMFT